MEDAKKTAMLLEHAEMHRQYLNKTNPGLAEILEVLALVKFGGDPRELNAFHSPSWHELHYFDTVIPGSEARPFEDQVDRMVRSVLLHFAAQQSYYYRSLRDAKLWGSKQGREKPEYQVWARIRDVATAFVGGMIALVGPSHIDAAQFGRTRMSGKSATSPEGAIGERIIAGIWGLNAPELSEGSKGKRETYFSRQKISRLAPVMRCAEHSKHLATDPEMRGRWLELVFNAPLRSLDLAKLFPDVDDQCIDGIHSSAKYAPYSSIEDVYDLARHIVGSGSDHLYQESAEAYRLSLLADF